MPELRLERSAEMTWRTARTDRDTAMSDHRRFPGCRLLLTCTQCGWTKDYAPERVIDRLCELRAGGHRTRLAQVARQARACPRCHSTTWRAAFAWPAGMTDREIKRLANLYRS